MLAARIANHVQAVSIRRFVFLLVRALIVGSLTYCKSLKRFYLQVYQIQSSESKLASKQVLHTDTASRVKRNMYQPELPCESRSNTKGAADRTLFWNRNDR